MKVLLYYYAFPHYRKEIIENLISRSAGDVEIAAGTRGRDDIKPLTSDDLQSLVELQTASFGPFSWQRGIFNRAISSEFESVVLGPATASLTTWAILLVRRLFGRQTYLWGQCGRKGERTVKRFLQEIMNRLASGLLVYGQSERAAATELGLDDSKVSIVFNATRTNSEFQLPESGINAYKRMQTRAEEAASHGDVTILYIGRLVPEKRVEVLLEAARHSRKRYKNLKVIIVGGGPELATLEQTYPEEFIDFRGWVYDSDELNQLIGDATFVISPYHIGLLAVDALRVGTPVLYPDQPLNGPEMESLSLGVNALTFTPGDSVAISEAIDHWFSIASDIRQEEFINRRDVALGNWSPDNVAARILESIDYR